MGACVLACALVLVSAEEDIGRATRLLEAGEVAEAKALLGAIEESTQQESAQQDRQLRFLKAHLALREGDSGRAIALFRQLLSEDPSLIRVRLDLARALYETGEFEAATYHFELALGAGIPDAVRRNVQAYLERMRYAETTASLHAGIATDSNPGQGPRTDTINLFGLPFQLSPAAQPKRATALVINASGRVALGADRRSYLLASLDAREYSDSLLNYRIGQVGVGHSIPLEGWRIGAEAGGYATHFQKQTLSEGPWARAYAWGKLGPSLLLNPSLARRWSDYPSYDFLSGTQDSAALDATLAASPSLVLSAGITFGKTGAVDPVFAFDSVELRFGARKEVLFGLIIGARFAYARSNYQAEDPLFGGLRRDRQRRLELELSLRDFSLWGFAPTLFVSKIRNDSNFDLYAWDRELAGVGATTRF